MGHYLSEMPYPVHKCAAPSCGRSSVYQGFNPGAETYEQLCAEHWEEQLASLVAKMIENKTIEQVIDTFAPQLIMLHRRAVRIR